MRKVSLMMVALLVAGVAQAECEWVWTDHDYDAGTPAIQQQICDNTFDVPSVRMPSVAPIQMPQVRPIDQPRVPPIGTQTCVNQSVYENGRWVNKPVCY